jgi:hypothetical protein
MRHISKSEKAAIKEEEHSKRDEEQADEATPSARTHRIASTHSSNPPNSASQKKLQYRKNIL